MTTKGSDRKTCIISACLLGDICRYNGKALESDQLENLLKDYRIIKVCPEVDGGLPTPRKPAEIDCGDGMEVLNGTAKVITSDGDNVSSEFIKGAHTTLKVAEQNSPCLIILKSRSPSCGSGRIYNGTFTGILKDGYGVTAALLKQNGFTVYDEISALNVLKK